MVDAAKDNPNAQLLVRTLKFSTGATWVTPTPVNVEDFAWDDLDAGGVTDLGKAFEMLAAQLTIPPMSDRALPPVIVLLSDGQPTDDYKSALDRLLHLPWGKKQSELQFPSVRMRMMTFCSSLPATANWSCRQTTRRRL